MSSAQPSPGPSASSLPPTAPSRGRTSGLGLMTGAAEEKYRLKVRELKAKIRAVEQDNDKMYTKTLEAKRNIQRLRIERAIIYERLHAGPPQPPPSPPQPAYRDVVLAPTDVEGADYYRKNDIPVRPEIDPRTGQYIQVARAPTLAPTSSGRSSRHPQASPLDTLPPSNAPTHYPLPPPAHAQAQYAPQPSHHYPQSSPSRAYSPPRQQSMHRHQRLGPGAIIAQDAERDQQRVHEWEAEQARRHQHGQPPYPYDARYDRAPDRRYEYAPQTGHPAPPPVPVDDRHYRDEREREYSHGHVHPHAHSHSQGPGHHQHSHSHHSQNELSRARSGSSTSHAPHHERERERERERDVEMDDRTSA
ncbi:unnamed protein product [Peniophora sp. CBMAI 1063]|nr:unnamed protein product [Peniophora sp. CBMAI 1063]